MSVDTDLNSNRPPVHTHTDNPAHTPPLTVRVGVYTTVEDADNVIDRLLEAGFTKDELSVICSDEHKERHFHGLAKHQPTTTSHMSKGVSIGAGTGLALGTVAAITGLVTGGGAILLGAGALVGLGVTGTLIGAFTSRGVEPEDADFYDQEVQFGNILVSVHSTDAARLGLAEQIIAESNAKPIQLHGD